MKIGENPDLINESSLLELESTSRAMVLSRVNNEQMLGINPLEGALIYNTDESCIFYYNGTAWANLCNGSGSSSFIENEDGTFSFNTSTGPITFDPAPETVTRFIDNEDGTYTYIDENERETIVNFGIIEGEHVGTPGSVFFANSSNGTPFEANENFFWDNINKRLGIGTNSPETTVEVIGILRSSRLTSLFGSESFPAYHFTGSFNTGLYAPLRGALGIVTGGSEVVRVTNDNRVGIMVKNPQATLHVGGDLRVDGAIIGRNGTTVAKQQSTTTSIRRISTRKALLTLTDYTVIVEEVVEHLTLPIPGEQNLGHIYVIKDLGGQPTEFNIPYIDVNSEESLITNNKGMLWLQSDGTDWQQIN